MNSLNNSVSLNAHDRCDRCGAQAYAVARKNGLKLMFCLHDVKKNNLALESDDWAISYDYDNIERLVGTGDGVLV